MRALRRGNTGEVRQRLFEHLAVKKLQRGERLVLRRSRHALLVREVREKIAYGRRWQLGRVPATVKAHIRHNPSRVCLDGARAEPTDGRALTQRYQQAGRCHP